MASLLRLLAVLFTLTIHATICYAALRTRQQALEELGLKRMADADDKTIKAAYRQRSLETHPDKGGSPDDFVQVADAYEFLMSKGANTSPRGYPYHTGFDPYSQMTEEEKVEWARDKFFEHFTTVMEDSDATAQAVADWMFDPKKRFEKRFEKRFANSWAARPAKAVVHWISRKCTTTLTSMFESENVVITFSSDGRKMTGTEFTQRRPEAMERKNSRVTYVNAILGASNHATRGEDTNVRSSDKESEDSIRL